MKALLILAALVLLAQPVAAAEFHVSPSGTPAGDGSAGAPWDLATALAHPPGVAPGDTIWLHHGVYRGPFTSGLRGTAERPIVVRQAPGERAVLDGGCSGAPTVLVDGNHTWYWGFEVLNSDPHRSTTERGSFPQIPRGIGLYTREVPGGAVGVRFVNLVVHDTAEGFGVWKDAEGVEVYGSLIYYNGWDAPDRGHGHGIYAQNQNGTMRLVDNVLFDQFSHGIHAYGSSAAYLNGLHLEGNIAFNNGRLSAASGNARNLLVGGGRVAENPVVVDNATYYPFGTGGENNFGLFAGTQNLLATGNYFAGDVSLRMEPANNQTAVLTGNVLVGGIDPFSPSDHPGNTYLPAVPPGGTHVVIRPNQYEAGRAHVAVFNWDSLPAVAVDLSSVLAVGQAYEVRDAENFFGPQVAGGVYAGGTVDFPMQLTAVAEPVGTLPVPPTHTGPEFGVFVVLPAVAPVSSCGNGVIEAGESCDDGGLLDGDGCSGACQTESLCDPAPASDCRRVVAPARSSLLATRQGGSRDTFVWRWQRGAATSADEFGDPGAGTRYEVCVYDGSSTLVQRIAVPAENGCGGPDWKQIGGTRRFKNVDQLPDGKLTVSLKSGGDGRAGIVVTGRGSFLSTMALPAISPLRVQLQRSGGTPCWEASFPVPKQNTSARLRATGG